jgi:hypothetical protein
MKKGFEVSAQLQAQFADQTDPSLCFDFIKPFAPR